MGMIDSRVINAAYELARQVYDDQLSESDAVRELVQQHAMNPSSAAIYVRNLRTMLEGKTLKRTMSASSFTTYLERIAADYGSSAARAAIGSVRSHVQYYNALGNGSRNGLVAVCDEAEARIIRAGSGMTLWTISAQYDDEAHVWYSTQGDIPGLNIDAETLDRLAAKAGAMLPDLLDIHVDDLVDKGRLQGPHRIRVVAFHEREYDVAA